MTPRDETHAPPCWEILDDTLLTACRVWDLRARRYRHPKTGKEGEFYYLDSRDWVIVIARTPAGELIMVRQFRWGADELCWEFPGGIVDPGEDPVEAGLRELREETGYVAERGRLIGTCSPNPAILNNQCKIVFADNVVLTDEGTEWDEHEEMEIRAVPEAEILQWAADCQIGHALALTGLLFYQLNVK
jgi:ADP-ribose pyrophosphatase